MVGREKNKGVDKKVGGTQDNGLGFCEKEDFRQAAEWGRICFWRKTAF